MAAYVMNVYNVPSTAASPLNTLWAENLLTSPSLPSNKLRSSNLKESHTIEYAWTCQNDLRTSISNKRLDLAHRPLATSSSAKESSVPAVGNVINPPQPQQSLLYQVSRMTKKRRRNRSTKDRKIYTGILDPRAGAGTAVHNKPGRTSRNWETYRDPALLNEPVITVVAPTKNVPATRKRPTILLENPVTCRECGTGLDAGSRVKRYPNGVYGLDCH